MLRICDRLTSTGTDPVPVVMLSIGWPDASESPDTRPEMSRPPELASTVLPNSPIDWVDAWAASIESILALS